MEAEAVQEDIENPYQVLYCMDSKSYSQSRKCKTSFSYSRLSNCGRCRWCRWYTYSTYYRNPLVMSHLFQIYLQLVAVVAQAEGLVLLQLAGGSGGGASGIWAMLQVLEIHPQQVLLKDLMEELLSLGHLHLLMEAVVAALLAEVGGSRIATLAGGKGGDGVTSCISASPTPRTGGGGGGGGGENTQIAGAGGAGGGGAGCTRCSC